MWNNNIISSNIKSCGYLLTECNSKRPVPLSVNSGHKFEVGDRFWKLLENVATRAENTCALLMYNSSQPFEMCLEKQRERTPAHLNFGWFVNNNSFSFLLVKGSENLWLNSFPDKIHSVSGKSCSQTKHTIFNLFNVWLETNIDFSPSLLLWEGL